uniref:RING-type domain-containing protein n=1 Tax=viral metagenome TaxID=1070528 RepID=A0A6C0IAR5_9ZZZZ
MAQQDQDIYGNNLLNDLHNHFPAFLYDSGRFQNVQDMFSYVQEQLSNRFDLYSNQRRLYLQSQQQHTPRSQQSHTPRSQEFRTPVGQRRARSPVEPPPLPVRRPAPTTIPESDEEQPLSDSEILETFITNALQRLIQQPLQPQTNAAAPLWYYNTTIPRINSFMDPVPVPLNSAQLAQNTTVETLTADSEQECAVCRDTMLTGATVRKITGCSHMFHRSCIDVWFQSNVRCPNCRHDVRTLNSNLT